MGLRVDGPLGRRFLRGLSLTAALPLRVVVGACGAVGVGTGTWAVLSSIPEG